MNFYESKKVNILEQLPLGLIEKGSLKTFEKGKILYRKGEQDKGLNFIKKGIVGLMGFSVSGDDTLLRVIGERNLLGYRSLLSSESYHASALALTDVELIYFKFDSVQQLQHEVPELHNLLTQTLAVDLRRAEQRLKDITGKRVISRVIETLIYLKQIHPDHPWTRREIGEFCGARTETVTRTLSKLERDGYIQKSGREIKLNDIGKLLEFSEQCEIF
ncbi:MAG: Crp/Fnr family transcriptional regulator [Bacteriovoracaceae bacterium]|nr:Crp/Fnr family transcriptional regulator [Bacteriovoracaceae bacterium]